MEFKTIKIEAISLKNNGIKPEKEKWITITGKAKDYLKELKKGQMVTLGLENGDCVYIKQAKNLKIEPQQVKEKNDYWINKEKRDIETNKWLKQQGVLTLAVKVMESRNIKDYSIEDLFQVAKEIYKRMKKEEILK